MMKTFQLLPRIRLRELNVVQLIALYMTVSAIAIGLLLVREGLEWADPSGWNLAQWWVGLVDGIGVVHEWLRRWVDVSVPMAMVVALTGAYLVLRHQARLRIGRLKNQLRQANERAAESSRMKTLFVRQISHEIRTPLNILLGFMHVMMMQGDGLELDEAQRTDIDIRMTNNSGRITRLVEKMLELSDAATLTVLERNDIVSTLEIAEQAINLSGIARMAHLEFSMKLESGVEDMLVITNCYHAVRALTQLLDNAIKFTHPPAEGDNMEALVPDVKEQVRLVVSHEEGEVVYTVSDTGCGVPQEEADRIFDEFVQLNEFYEGSGLGLAVAREIVRKLGGDIVLNSRFRAGAQFIMTLPI